MIKHKPINIDSFNNDVKSSLLQDVEVKTYQSFAAIEDIDSITDAYVFVSMVCVYIDSNNTQSPREFTILLSSIHSIFESNTRCIDIQAFGNCIVGVFDTPLKTDIDTVLDSVGMVNALFNLANNIPQVSGDKKIRKGIGMVYGKLLMSVLPQSPETIVNWSGELFQKVLDYSMESISSDSLVYISFSIYNNFKESYQKLFHKMDVFNDRYEGQPVNIAMDKWNHSNL